MPAYPALPCSLIEDSRPLTSAPEHASSNSLICTLIHRTVSLIKLEVQLPEHICFVIHVQQTPRKQERPRKPGPKRTHPVSVKWLSVKGLVPTIQRVLGVQLGSDVELIMKSFN